MAMGIEGGGCIERFRLRNYATGNLHKSVNFFRTGLMTYFFPVIHLFQASHAAGIGPPNQCSRTIDYFRDAHSFSAGFMVTAPVVSDVAVAGSKPK